MPSSHRRFIYKKTPQGELAMHVHLPKDWKPTDKRAAIVFFFGGGWNGGTTEQFRKQAEYFASRGMVAARADYRVKSRHGVTPDQCVSDAKSAVRYLRANAAKLGIDPARIVASGGSAGGHIAACTALTAVLDEPTEDAAVSSVPNAMVLFNPVAKLVGKVPLANVIADPKLARALSPCLNVKADSPPAIVFYGDKDKFYTGGGREFEKAATAVGAKMRFVVYHGQDHGFFNHTPFMQRTLIEADTFLTGLGYLKGKPTIAAP